MKVSVIGSGSWGTALANVLATNQHDVTIWGLSQEDIDDIVNNQMNQRYFGDVKLNSNLKATTDFNVVKDAEIFLLAVPSIAIEEICHKINENTVKPVIIINVAKGFHPTTHDFLMDVIRKNIDEDKLKSVVSLIGPSHAEEVVRDQLTAVNAVSKDLEAAQLVQHLFSNDVLRVYTNDDEIGAQIGVAIKNIIALASGIAKGAGQGDNARAALITRGLAEMARYGMYFGGKFETFLGLCGVGDLVVTASSEHSRNFQAGYAVGLKGSAKEFNETNKTTVEGVAAAKIVHDVALEKGISMPITEEVYKVFYEDKDPATAIKNLMNRDLKHELI
ncbi:MAG TPA: NAD(P)H-dependent glycerol-3-phosphate dehydrogenase [Erysipelothrix sp.]|nr:NAD(P)H-dependent glycerol-3-phosphate dehydrogenase [Erysipelothrix sp.]